MEFIILELPSYNNYQVTVSRNFLRELFPDSFLATTLQAEESEVIPIPSSAITPPILDFIAQMISTGLIPDVIPRKDNMIEASRYLLIDILAVVVDTKYDYFHIAYPDINLLQLNPITR